MWRLRFKRKPVKGREETLYEQNTRILYFISKLEPSTSE